MTASNGPEDKKPGKGARDQRPHATLDLTAQDVSPKSASTGGNGDTKSEGAAGAKDKPAGPDTPRSASSGGGGSGGRGAGRQSDGWNAGSLAGHFGAGALGAVLALIFGYVIFTDDRSGRPTQDLEPIRAELAQAGEQLASVQNRIREVAEQTERIEAIANQAEQNRRDLAGLSQRVSDIEARPRPEGATEQDVRQSLDPLTKRLSELESQLTDLAKTQDDLRAEEDRGPALAMALYNLQRATENGRPFATELQTIAEMSPVPLDLGGLQPHGQQGVQSVEQLQSAFDAYERAAIEAENQPTDDSLTSNVWSRVKSLVTVKREGNVPGDTPRAILARTEYQLSLGQLQGALTEAKQLQGPAADAMAPWIAQLEARITAEDALAEIEAKLLSTIGRNDAAGRAGQ